MIPILPVDPHAPFPPLERALHEPNGLLCAGGDLSAPRLLNAYHHGIFPWFNPGEPILWWSPDPRMVFRSDSVRLSSKFRRQLRHNTWTLRADSAFAAVMRACAISPRPGQHGTWIGDDMLDAYVELHRLGHAHSIEVFDGERLVGGIYGVAIGRMFYGESMFSGVSGGSKIALAALARLLDSRGWPLIDAQVESPHLRTLGAETMPREIFARRIATLVEQPGRIGSWCNDLPDLPVSGLS
ncbi:leucyl/phenylalanyl-tRNA--protein transferase [Lysobacter silvestris]|uniref:Leucyl/phenylalanyl-tRNA--protein transferase n=1 Tax=Solilutibacter silvestris TaxID=1645665 RepID=A0A2K1PZ96_9GAMM|nr:aat: leucyl/phenylalanyl-tRNA--protein transferase [Lysobacter silvestris]